MHQPTDPTRQGDQQPEVCCHCGTLTARPVKIGEVHTASGAGRNLYACQRHALRYEPQTGDRP